MTATPSDTKLFRSERYRALGGVCSGVALSRGFSISLTRLIALLLLTTGIGLALYLVLWLVVPTATKAAVEEPTSLPTDAFQRNPDDKFVAGVCSGLADFLKIDTSIVRVVYLLALICTGVGVLPYLYAWIVVPSRAPHRA